MPLALRPNTSPGPKPQLYRSLPALNRYNSGYSLPCNIYETNRDGVSYEAAYVSSFGGYPVEIEQSDSFKILVALRLYDNHFSGFGIASVGAWVKLAPYIFDAYQGYIITNIDMEATRAMVANMQSTEGSTRDYRYVATLRCNGLVFDLGSLIKRIGFEVPASYVRRNFANETYVESPLAEKNVVWKNRQQAKVLNLSEYSGPLARFLDTPGQWRFYAVVDYHDTTSEEELKHVRSSASSAEEKSHRTWFWREDNVHNTIYICHNFLKARTPPGWGVKHSNSPC